MDNEELERFETATARFDGAVDQLTRLTYDVIDRIENVFSKLNPPQEVANSSLDDIIDCARN